MLRLHLVPDGVSRLHAGCHVVFQPHSIKTLPHRSGKFLIHRVAVLGGSCYLLVDFLVDFGVLIFEAKVFKLGLYCEKPKAVRKRRIYVERFTGNLILLAGQHRAECAHIVEAVSHLDEDNANIVVHRQQQLAEVLSLCRSTVTEDSTRNLGETIYYLCYLLAKLRLNVLNRVVGILNHIVKQRGTYRG